VALVLQKHGVSCRLSEPNFEVALWAYGLLLMGMGSYCIVRALIIVREKHLPDIERADWDLVES